MPLISYAAPISEPYAPGYSSIDASNYSLRYESLLFGPGNNVFALGTWDIYVDGYFAGVMWYFENPKGNIGRCTISPNLVSTWATAFGGNPNYVASQVSIERVYNQNGKPSFQRAAIRDVIAHCGAAVASADSGRVRVITTPKPSGRISAPFGGVQEGSLTSLDISGQAYAGDTLRYEIYVDGRQVDSGITGKTLNKAISYTFTRTGSIPVELRLTDAFQRSNTIQSNIQVQTAPTPSPAPDPPRSGKTGPVALFDLPASTKVDLFVFAKNNSYAQNGATITANQWSISPASGTNLPGGVSTGKDIQPKFSRAGTYTVTLTVRDSNGLSDTMTKTIRVEDDTPPVPPTAQAYFEMPSQVYVGDPIEVVNKSFNREHALLEQWLGNPPSGYSGPTTDVSFFSVDGGTLHINTPGTYWVQLFVVAQNPIGYMSNYVRSVEVLERAKTGPIADFTVKSFANQGETLTVVNRSSDPDGYIVKNEWTVSPKNGAEQNLSAAGGTVRFVETGTYTIHLKVTDDDGLTDTHEEEVLVESSSPVAQLIMPQTAYQGTRVVAEDHSYGQIAERLLEVSPAGPIVEQIQDSQGHITFNETGLYTVTLTVTNEWGLSDTDICTIEIVNDPPVARMNLPEYVIQGVDFTIYDLSFDPEDDLVATNWTIEPAGGLIGELSGTASTVYFDTEGEYTIKLRVEDKWGLSDEVTKTIEVRPAIPAAVLDISGTQKVNRKLTLDATKSVSIERYPLLATEWEILPLNGQEDAIKIDPTSPEDKRALLFKAPGKYKVRMRVLNEKHPSKWVEETLVILPDEAPIANFYVGSMYLRDPEDGNRVRVNIVDESYSPDGDTIAQRIWRYRFDSNNDGSFLDENWITFDEGNNRAPELILGHVGRYEIELMVREEFGQETIETLVTPDDRLTADTSNKLARDKMFVINNAGPYVDFDVAIKQKVDILFVVGDVAESKVKDLEAKINQYIKPKLAAKAIDFNLAFVEAGPLDYDGDKVFNYTGGVQTFTAPVAGEYLLEVWGAQGGSSTHTYTTYLCGNSPQDYYESHWTCGGCGQWGSNSGLFTCPGCGSGWVESGYWTHRHDYRCASTTKTATAIGGKGGYSQGVIRLEEGETLSIYVGGSGANSTSGTANGGYNGGGTGRTYSGGGGGATDIRKGGTTSSHRIIVAGSGGGATSYATSSATYVANGGDGGGLAGANGNKHAYWSQSYSNTGGTQSAGGTSSYSSSANGALDKGGNASSSYAGGAGNGYYGGAAGAYQGYSGAGGSGYIGGVQAGKMETGVRSGHGQAKVSLLSTKLDFVDAIKTPIWAEGSTRFIVHIEDTLVSDLTDPNIVADILATLASNDVNFLGLGSATNKAQLERLVMQNSGKGAFYSNTNMNNALTQVADYILNLLQQTKQERVQYVVLGEEMEYTTYYGDMEHDPEYARRWMYTHDYTVFENTLGLAAYDQQWLSDPITVFDKVGKFNVVLQARDNPVGTDDRFDEFREWSSISPTPMAIFVHRKPVAQFTASAVPDSQERYRTFVSESSYDPDHESTPHKGIVEKEWKWKDVDDTSWQTGLLPETLPVNKNYLVSLRVKDEEGAWSNAVVQFLTTKNINLPPIAQFTLSPNPCPLNGSVAITDRSYDPNGDPIAVREWTITKGSQKIYESTTMPSSVFFRSHGVGDYQVTLRVQDQPLQGLPLWSDPFSQTLKVIVGNTKPVARFTVSPNPAAVDSTVTYVDTSYDPDGDPLVAREWQIKLVSAATWDAVANPPRTFTALGIGSYQIRLRVKDQPSLPQLEPLWSDWYEQVVTVTAGNQKPIAQFTIDPNPAALDEMITYIDTSYDPEGRPLAERLWRITCLETGLGYEYRNLLPPQLFTSTGWGINRDGVGTYNITLEVKDVSPNGISPALWSDPYLQTLVIWGHPEISVTPDILDYGEVKLGDAPILEFTVQNTGNQALIGSISSSSPVFRVRKTDIHLLAGETMKIPVQAIPLTVGSYWGNITFETNAYSTPIVTKVVQLNAEKSIKIILVE